MHLLRKLLLSLLILCCVAPVANAEDLVLAAGAGYKKMVNALNASYAKKTGKSLNLIYGNMGRVTTLANKSGKVDFVLGDETFLTKAGVPMVEKQELGRGRLVLAFAKTSKCTKVEDLDDETIKRIALPDTKKAIYGRAAREFLQNSGRLPAIQPRLVEVATVPQVFSYLNTNEVDMGFLNLTHALNVRDKIGGFVAIDTDQYAPIRIIIGVLDSCSDKPEAEAFLAFLKTPEAKAIVQQHGL